jgi:hypothetical protein
MTTNESGICVLYQKGEVSAERMYLVEPIINKYIRDNGIRLDRNSVFFLEISSEERRHPRRDHENLKRMSKLAKVFVSQLNSTSCEYLRRIFFDLYLDTVHISSFSTATSLIGVPNLIRYQVPDVEIRRIYLYNIQKFTGNCVIIYQKGIYYEDLSRSIEEATTQAGIPTLRLLKENFNLDRINEFVTDNFSIVFVVDDPLTYVRQMQTDPIINQKNFQILVSDTGVQQLTDDPSLLEYLNMRSARLFQFFINLRQLLIAQEYNNFIDDPLHPVSSNVDLLFICFDWAVLVTNTNLSNRLTRTVYLDVYLDKFLDNTNNIYGGYSYIPNNLQIDTFYFVYQSVLYIGEEVFSMASLPVKTRPTPIAPVNKIKSKSGFCRNIGICVLYDENGFAAERSFEVQRIIGKYIADNGLKIKRNRLDFLQLSATRDVELDARNLKEKSIKHKVFVSALGTGRCQYLADIFFNQNLDCLHLNSFSTAPQLSTIPNLARFQSPDSTVVGIYLYQIQLLPGNCVIVYEGGTYSTSLSLEIAIATTNAGIETLRIHRDDLTSEILNSFTTDNFTIVYILGIVMPEIAKLQADPTINQKNFQILTSDSASLDVPRDQSTVDYLNSKNARLIQNFLNDRQLEIWRDYSEFINNPSHPVSTIVSLFLSCFDWAVLVTNTEPKNRLTRLEYQNLQLNRFLENTNNIYGTYSYILNGLVISDFFFVYEDKIYVGNPIDR